MAPSRACAPATAQNKAAHNGFSTKTFGWSLADKAIMPKRPDQSEYSDMAKGIAVTCAKIRDKVGKLPLWCTKCSCVILGQRQSTEYYVIDNHEYKVHGGKEDNYIAEHSAAESGIKVEDGGLECAGVPVDKNGQFKDLRLCQLEETVRYRGVGLPVRARPAGPVPGPGPRARQCPAWPGPGHPLAPALGHPWPSWAILGPGREMSGDVGRGWEMMGGGGSMMVHDGR